MSRRCELTGQGPRTGHNVSHAHNISLRRWNVNLQKVKVLINGKPVRMRVSTSAIKSGLVVRPPVKVRQRGPKVIRPRAEAPTRGIIQEEQPPAGFFSDTSITSRLFKPKPKPVEGEITQPIPGVDIPAFDAPEPYYGAELNAPPKKKG